MIAWKNPKKHLSKKVCFDLCRKENKSAVNDPDYRSDHKWIELKCEQNIQTL